MKNRIYLSPPHLDGREKEFIIEAYDSNWISTFGPHVDAFEKEICDRVSIPFTTALSSGTAALHLALLMLGVTTGDEVLCSTFTFSATANAITYCGATPVFIDSNDSTWNMDPILLQEELKECKQKGKIPKAVIVVDLYGQTADYDPIVKICKEYNIPIIEDAAESLGATYKGKSAGSFGEMGVFSFNGNKIITTSGGGMLVSSNKQYIDRAKYLATQARDSAPHFQHSDIGYNYRMSNMLAAIGRGQLEQLSNKIARRKEINRYYKNVLGEIPGINFMPIGSYGEPNYWLTCITIDPFFQKIMNEEIRSALEKKDIETRLLLKPMHLQPIFQSCRVRGGAVTEKLFAQGLCLPSGSGMTDGDLQRVTDEILLALKK